MRFLLLLASTLLIAGAPAPRVSSPPLPDLLIPMAGPPSSTYLGQRFLSETVPLLRQRAERVRVLTRPEDRVLATEAIAGLVAIALLQHRPADAITLISEARAAATKPRQRAFDLLHF